MRHSTGPTFPGPGRYAATVVGLLSVALMVSLSLATSIAAAQTADTDTVLPQMAEVSGPGQPIAQPTAECPETPGCQYAEQNFLPNVYRFQSFQVCGANCTTQYWVSTIQTGDQLLEIDPLREGAVLAVGSSTPANNRPPVRVVMPEFAAADPACCPSAYTDTTYAWDAATSSLVPGAVTTIPAEEFPGWDVIREQLTSSGWIVTNV